MVEIEFVSPSTMAQEPLRLRVKKINTIADVKVLIQEKHVEKPPIDAQKIIYKGRQLLNEQIIGDALSIGLSGVLEGTNEAKFHLLIDKRKTTAAATGQNMEENKTQAAMARVQQAQQRRIHHVPAPAG